jgi:anti-sigma B factor antagonist
VHTAPDHLPQNTSGSELGGGHENPFGDPASHFGVHAELCGREMTLALTGELDLATTPALERAVDASPWQDLDAVVIDLAGVTFVDSTGLSVLIRASQHASSAGKAFSVIRASEQPTKLFQIAGVIDGLGVQD